MSSDKGRKPDFNEVISRRVRPTLIPPMLRRYQALWVRPDLLAGLTLAAIAIPEQMATARLADMPALTGLYAFVAGSIAFVVVGWDLHLSVGADSTITPIFATGVATVAAVGSPRYVALVIFEAGLRQWAAWEPCSTNAAD